MSVLNQPCDMCRFLSTRCGTLHDWVVVWSPGSSYVIDIETPHMIRTADRSSLKATTPILHHWIVNST